MLIKMVAMVARATCLFRALVASTRSTASFSFSSDSKACVNSSFNSCPPHSWRRVLYVRSSNGEDSFRNDPPGRVSDAYVSDDVLLVVCLGRLAGKRAAVQWTCGQCKLYTSSLLSERVNCIIMSVDAPLYDVHILLLQPCARWSSCPHNAADRIVLASKIIGESIIQSPP